MCLTKFINEDETRNLKIASEDIAVFKTLKEYHNRWFTPYMCEQILFDDNGVAVQEENNISGVEIGKDSYNLDYYEGKTEPKRTLSFLAPDVAPKGQSKIEISRGIHSSQWDRVTGFDVSCALVVFWAIIPKGARYMKGVCGDYVSDKLIIFYNKNSYDRYTKKEVLQ